MALTALDSVRLGLYNNALRILSETRLTATEDRKPRRVLDDIWDDGALNFCLEQGYWNFAMRTQRIEYEPSLQPDFGFQRVFTKPSDFIRMAKINSEEFFRCRFTDYDDQAGHWYANVDTLYVQFVSNDTDYGADTSLWPETFKQYVASYLAQEGCGSIAGKPPSEEMKRDHARVLFSARAKDAMNEAAQSRPQGSWSTSRRGGIVGSRWNESWS